MQPMVEKVGNRIHLRSDFSDKDVAKSVIGARWSANQRRWTYPLDLETCRRLRDAFGERLVIGQNLWDWADEERTRESDLGALRDLSKMDLTQIVDLPRVRTSAPTMWAAMQNRPYQPVASKYMSEAIRCLNGDQPGIGKTIETLAALVERGVVGPILILAPKTSCMVVWQAEIAKWLADDVPYTIHTTVGMAPDKRNEVWEGFSTVAWQGGSMHFMICNADQAGIKVYGACPAGICNGDEDWCPAFDKHRTQRFLRSEHMHQIEWAAIVADETHKWLINTRGKSASQVGYGFTRLRVVEGGPMYALSGTPLKGKKWNLWGTLNWLWPRTYTSKWRWIESYFQVVKEEVLVRGGRGATKEVKKITGQWLNPKAETAFHRSLQSVIIRRTKDELRAINPAWMPAEKRYHDVWVPMEGSQRTHYRQMEKDAAAVFRSGERLTATGILAYLTRLKQFASSDGEMVKGNFKPTLPSGKFNWLMQFLEERGIEEGGDLSDDVQKVVVASQYTSLIKVWAAEMERKGITVAQITGEIKDKDRVEAQRAFQEDDDVRVMLINTNAGGVSITLDAADDVVIMDETWVPDDQEQVEDRAHRASNVTHQVDVWYVRTKDTVEEGIAQTNRVKGEANHVVLDAQRGLRFAAERFGAITGEEK